MCSGSKRRKIHLFTSVFWKISVGKGLNDLPGGKKTTKKPQKRSRKKLRCNLLMVREDEQAAALKSLVKSGIFNYFLNSKWPRVCVQVWRTDFEGSFGFFYWRWGVGCWMCSCVAASPPLSFCLSSGMETAFLICWVGLQKLVDLLHTIRKQLYEPKNASVFPPGIFLVCLWAIRRSGCLVEGLLWLYQHLENLNLRSWGGLRCSSAQVVWAQGFGVVWPHLRANWGWNEQFTPWQRLVGTSRSWVIFLQLWAYPRGCVLYPLLEEAYFIVGGRVIYKWVRVAR